MVTIKTDDTDLGQICDSGQCFRMRRTEAPGDTSCLYEVIATNRRLLVAQTEDGIALDCTGSDYDSFWKDYFDLDTDYGAIKALVHPEDKYLTHAVNVGGGLRILRQDLWEMIVTFLISQQNNIVRIHRCVDNICREYGEYIENGDYYSFPTPDSLCSLGEDDLMPCNLGYRSKYVVRAARAVACGDLDLDAIRRMEYEEARETLLKVYGIGNKVADCICLFGLHHLSAFPVDTHIKQVLLREYGDAFDFDRYKNVLGVIQQYMFYNEIA